jgi:hypothetical protein
LKSYKATVELTAAAHPVSEPLEARKLTEEQYKKFDEYSVRTDKNNVERLPNSLKPKLRQMINSLNQAAGKNKMFTIYWLRVVEVTQKHTLEFIQFVQDKIKALLPQAFPGENIQEYGVTILALAQLPTNAGQ